MKNTKDYSELIRERINYLNKGNSLEVAVEGRYTNLIIRKSDGFMYMRLDKANQYNAPLSLESYGYLDKPNAIIAELVKKFGFKSSDNDLEDIVTLTAPMKERHCIAW
jgi:hypothetical protein